MASGLKGAPVGGTLAPATRWLVPRTWADLFNRPYRAIKAQARGRRTAGKVGAAQLHREVQAAANELARWRELAGPTAMPIVYPEVTTLRERLNVVQGACRSLAPLTPHP